MASLQLNWRTGRSTSRSILSCICQIFCEKTWMLNEWFFFLINYRLKIEELMFLFTDPKYIPCCNFRLGSVPSLRLMRWSKSFGGITKHKPAESSFQNSSRSILRSSILDPPCTIKISAPKKTFEYVLVSSFKLSDFKVAWCNFQAKISISSFWPEVFKGNLMLTFYLLSGFHRSNISNRLIEWRLHHFPFQHKCFYKEEWNVLKPCAV